MDANSIIKELSKKEIDFGLYNAKINDVSIYAFIRHVIRRAYMEKAGGQVMDLQLKIDKKSLFESALLSLFHLIKLFLSHKSVSNVLYSFPRVDKVGDYYIDKFTDPFVDVSSIGEDYIILDHGRAGRHPQPRLHHNKIIFTDLIDIYSVIYSKLFSSRFYSKHKEEFDDLYNSIRKGLDVDIEKTRIINSFLRIYVYSYGIYYILKHISAKRVLGPARAQLYAPFYAAHKLGLKTFELQHGITYGESILYSGYREKMIMPDYFLAFGDNKPNNVYGIDERRIINIGWAFYDYVAKIQGKDEYNYQDVLVISDPEITDSIVSAVLRLASVYPSSTFYIRPHPHEVITDKHLKMIEQTPNVKLQDKSINIAIVLQGFTHVVGENSTVLYEALADHKKVGKLCLCGLHPKYLEESDKDCFWEIGNEIDFERYINDDINAKKNKSIYSPFNRVLFEKTIGLNK